MHPTLWSGMRQDEIRDNFYQQLTVPKNLEDAHIWMCCYKQSIEDFDLQIKINDAEMQSLCDDGKPLPYHEDKYHELKAKEHKLLTGKRFHQNASHCYWYWLQRHEEKV